MRTTVNILIPVAIVLMLKVEKTAVKQVSFFFIQSHSSPVHQHGYIPRKRDELYQIKTGGGNCMAMSKKQLGKQNKVKKAKAEVLSKQAAGGSDAAKKKLKKLNKKIK